MFKQRLLSGIILLAIMISAVVYGGDVLFALIVIISFIGLMELYRVLNIHKTIIGLLGYLTSFTFDILLYWKQEQYIFMVIIIFLLLIMASYVICYPKFNSEHITLVFFGVFYVSIMLSYLYSVRILEGGLYLIWLIFIGAWGSDTCAYCVGVLFGKHKLPSQLSPKKSIEGCIGGVIGAALIGFIFATLFGSKIEGIDNIQISFALIGGAASIISQIGDLAASAIKRNHGIKDYGKLIPGHGGILDRFDSIIFTAPIVYYLIDLMK